MLKIILRNNKLYDTIITVFQSAVYKRVSSFNRNYLEINKMVYDKPPFYMIFTKILYKPKNGKISIHQRSVGTNITISRIGNFILLEPIRSGAACDVKRGVHDLWPCIVHGNFDLCAISTVCNNAKCYIKNVDLYKERSLHSRKIFIKYGTGHLYKRFPVPRPGDQRRDPILTVGITRVTHPWREHVHPRLGSIVLC